MGRNIEVKARATDFGGQRARAEELAGAGPEVLTQEDTFFRTKRGRLKLRRFNADRGELIYYERDGATGPRESRYMLIPTRDPDGLKSALASALGVRGTVRKRRAVYLVHGTRVHLDEVEGLGEFVELEAVLGPDETPSDGRRRVDELMDALGIEESDLVDVAYIDLIVNGEGSEGSR